MGQDREYYDKEFTCQDSSITRGELESLPCPFRTKTYQPPNTMRTSSSQKYSQLLHNLDCRRGAPLGRPDGGTEAHSISNYQYYKLNIQRKCI